MADDYAVAQPIGQVRLLLNDVTAPFFFSNAEIQAFLDLEGASVKRAAAQAIDTNADSEVLASKVLRTQDVSTDGAKVADSLRKRAVELRRQADVADAAADEGFFEIIDTTPVRPELVERSYLLGWP